MYLKVDRYGDITDVPGQGATPKRFRPGIRPDRIPRGPPRIRPVFTPGPRPPRLPLPVRVAPIIGAVPALLWVGDVIDGLMRPIPNMNRYLPSGWVECFDCGRRPGYPSYAVTSGPSFVDYPPLTGWMWQGSSNCFGPCLDAQAPSDVAHWLGGLSAPFTIPAAAGAIWLQDARYHVPSTGVRARHDRLIRRITGSGPVEFPYAAPWTIIPAPLPAAPPSPFYGPEPLPYPEPPALPEPPPYWQVAPNWPPMGPGPVPVSPKPPSPHQKEHKVFSRTKSVGIWLWRLMDTISELTEIGGAFYKALPKEIRDRYNCASGTNIGQYGSDLNACMARALWENWDQIDPGRAFIGIAENIVEDMTIGQFHKWLSRVSPPGFSWQKTAMTTALAKAQPEKYIAGRLKELFAWLGLD